MLGFSGVRFILFDQPVTVQPNTIALARASHLMAFTDVLRQMGVPFDTAYRKFRLPELDLLLPDMYIPVRTGLDFLELMEKRESVEDLGFQAARKETIKGLTDDFIDASRSTPTLYGRLCLFAKLAPLENTHCRLSMRREGNAVRIINDMIGCSAFNGLRHSEWLQVAVMLEIIRDSVACDWQPLEITFQSLPHGTSVVSEYFPNTRILFDQPHTSIKVPLSLFARSNPGAFAEKDEHGDSVASQPASAPIPEYPHLLRKLLRAYVRNGYPDVRLISDITGTSVRTLQRRLAEHGLSHAELVLQTRFEIASELLGDPDIKVVEVAYEVGYSDPSNFIRAFRKIAGMTPDEWRRQQLS